MIKNCDVLIVGGGILGTSLSYCLSLLSDYRIAVVEQEQAPAMHSSTRNTGVIHRPFYLDPAKKKVFANAAQHSYFLWKELAQQFSLPWNQNGTIEVAVEDSNLDDLQKYEKYARMNGMEDGEFQILDSSETSLLEPMVRSKGSFYSKTDTGVSFGEFAKTLMSLSEENSVTNFMGKRLVSFDDSNGIAEISDNNKPERIQIKFGTLINVAGGGALKIARMADLAKKYSVLHFRGDYWRINQSFRDRIKRNIYSVPRHQKYPFLDPHFVIRHDGLMEIGPNAALVSGPYGYMRGDSNRRPGQDILSRPLIPKFNLFTNMEFIFMVRQEWKSSMSRKAMVNRMAKFIPDLKPADAMDRGLSGIRHSLIDSSGFVPEAILLRGKSSMHVLNFNSPGATGAPAYSAYIVNRMIESGYLSDSHMRTEITGYHPWSRSLPRVLEEMK